MPGTDSGGGGGTHTERGREQRGAAALQNGDKQIRKHVVLVKSDTVDKGRDLYIVRLIWVSIAFFF